MKEFIIKSQIYTKQSYPRALWIHTRVAAENDQEALDKFYHEVVDKLDFVSADTEAEEVK